MSRPVSAGALTFVGNLAVRRIEFFEAGDFIHAHTHFFDHVTFVVQGAIEVAGRAVRAPAFFETKADTEHTMTALEPAVSYCVFAIRDEFGHVLQADEIEPSDRTQEARFAN